MKNLDKDIEKVLIDAVKIQERVCEMGAQITKDYEGGNLFSWVCSKERCLFFVI